LSSESWQHLEGSWLTALIKQAFRQNVVEPIERGKIKALSEDKNVSNNISAATNQRLIVTAGAGVRVRT